MLLDSIADRGALIQANRTLACIRKMFNFAIARDILEFSPCYMVKSVISEKDRKRERVLSEQEIYKFWHNISKANMSEGVKIILKLQLVTFQRKGEIVNMEWKEVDLEKGWWIIPKTKAKNKLSHRVPLSNLAIDLLNWAKRISNDSKYVFPSPTTNESISDDAISKALNRNREMFDIDHWTPHDLRRTASSMMASLGVARLTIKKILNHVENDVTAIYDRHSYDNEKKDALILWSQKLIDMFPYSPIF